MAIQFNADIGIGMFLDIETELDSEDSLYGNLDSDNSVKICE